MTLIATGTINVGDIGFISTDMIKAIAPLVLIIIGIQITFYILGLLIDHASVHPVKKEDDSYRLKEYLYKHGGEKHREE